MSAASVGKTQRKICIAVRSDLELWQKLNVVAFLTSGLGIEDSSVVGERYVDGDGRQYPPMLAHPMELAKQKLAVQR